ncbi:fructose transport system substrate-binding protein [Kineosphaera limosa]|uniref:Putative ABC transporter substrate-binding protein n=1 Tax=Kineosphaera limosa NBRC 100340 TaxID=1184609 RepID=K6WKQ9_9MICO|nr:substrate-binding domain-containing protein [Kineosphaera limosa]NYE02930.1 fructose transport system substrate-binding protein [Kineosphaera limosa]GAB94361.1 putative ABC transporter substrate-binding protein [Kineosphaera limosa NBRC 100340]
MARTQSRPSAPVRRVGRVWRLGAAALALGFTLGLGACSSAPDPVTIGLITKQEENPYWRSMKQMAENQASRDNVNLLTATGTSDVDVESQRRAIRDMVAQGAHGIILAPTSSTALNPDIEAARQAGVIVIAVDTPVDPVSTVDAYYATDNQEAGRQVGRYAAAKAGELGLTPRVAMLNLAPGISSGLERGAGFLEGMGLAAEAPELVASADTQGDRQLGEQAMASILAQHPDVNVVYTVNEQAALGALEALKAADADLSRMVIVSIDGGCQAMRDAVRPGDIDATAMQFPENMARESVRAIASAERGGETPSGYLNTGVELITDAPAAGVPSRDTPYGIRNCWG